MLVGLDFDNTIVSYDVLFYKIAREWDCIPEETLREKNAVRDYLRLVGKEDVWTRMQGYVYGARMAEAEAYPGFFSFLDALGRSGHRAAIVSHKTKYPFIGEKYDLHAAAGAWIQNHLLAGSYPALQASGIFFELTKEDKLNRIANQLCDLFIDDLPEILLSESFPAGVERILFDPADSQNDHPNYLRCNSWDHISTQILA